MNCDHVIGRVDEPGPDVVPKPLADVRAGLSETSLTAEERAAIVDQVRSAVDTVFVHRHQKKAMYGIDPVRRLQLLRWRAETLDDAAFHAELIAIVDELRDGHTVYTLPVNYRGVLAFLKFVLRRYWEGDQARWLAIGTPLPDDPPGALVNGAEVTHWNGVPIDVAIARNAEREVGNNPAARQAQGALHMTVRSLDRSPIPDEDWVELRFVVDGQVVEERFPWMVVRTPAETPPRSAAEPTVAPRRHDFVALDHRNDAVQRFIQPRLVENQPKPRSSDVNDVVVEPIDVHSPIAVARRVTTPSGTFGYLRIPTFVPQIDHVPPPDEVAQALEDILRGFGQLLDQMPREGLILDVRGNTGGLLYLAEMILQLFTPRPIQPTPFQLAVSEQTAGLCRAAPDAYGAFAASTEQGLTTGAQYSATLPFFDADLINVDGQRYQGPVVLVTDALCFSATDIFAAAFQSHGVGPVLGVDENTGAGGANVHTLPELHALWPDGPFRPMPSGADLRVAVSRALRVGAQAGQPLEDLGVRPDHLHRLTRRDLVEGDPDLLIRAAALLVAQRPDGRFWSLDVASYSDGVTLTTKNLSRVDVYRRGRPVGTAAVMDGVTDVRVPAGGPIRVEGYDGPAFVVARNLLR